MSSRQDLRLPNLKRRLEKFEALIRHFVTAFINPRAMTEGSMQEADVSKFVTK